MRKSERGDEPMDGKMFNGHVIGRARLLNLERFTECHPGRDFADAVTNPLVMLCEEFHMLAFCNAVMRHLKWLPKFFCPPHALA